MLGAVVLQRVERRPAVVVEGDELAVDHRLVRQLREALDDGGIPEAEVVVVAGAQMNPAAGLERDGAIAVELQLIFPARRLVRQRIRTEEQHRFYEGCLDSLDHQRSSSGLCRSCPGKSAFHIDVARVCDYVRGVRLQADQHGPAKCD